MEVVVVLVLVTGGGSECTAYFASLCKFTVSHISALLSRVNYTFLLRIGRVARCSFLSQFLSIFFLSFFFTSANVAHFSFGHLSVCTNNVIAYVTKSLCVCVVYVCVCVCARAGKRFDTLSIEKSQYQEIYASYALKRTSVSFTDRLYTQ